MGLTDFNATLDAPSLQRLARLQGFSALLAPEITAALTDSGHLLVGAAQANTWRVFANPIGRLAASIYFYVVSPMQVAVAVGEPYGQRRERGFSGKTDALGRFYPSDPGKPYLQPAVDEHQSEVLMLMEQGVNTVLGRVAM